MTDSSATTVAVPAELKQKFPQLIELILGSESMNDEERQYWINILPAMTDSQKENLRNILQNEKDQLLAIDAKYQEELKAAGQEKTLEAIAQERQSKSTERKTAEKKNEETERGKEKEILREIENLEEWEKGKGKREKEE